MLRWRAATRRATPAGQSQASARARTLQRLLPWLLLPTCMALTGCTAWISDATLSDDADYLWLLSTASEPRERFYASDPQVTLSVTFTPNFFAAFKSFRIDWIAPDGSYHLRRYLKTEWGSHRHVITSMPLADTPAADRYGRWRVELWHEEQRLVQREFEVLPDHAAPRKPQAG